MSDDLSRDDDRVRPTRESPMRPEPPPRPPRRRDDEDDDLTPRRPKDDGGVKTVLIVLGILGVVGFCMIVTVVLGFVYMVRTAAKQVQVAMAQAQSQVQSINNYKTVALALRSYHDRHGSFPPTQMKTKDGSPGLSWRVAILPFL